MSIDTFCLHQFSLIIWPWLPRRHHVAMVTGIKGFQLLQTGLEERKAGGPKAVLRVKAFSQCAQFPACEGRRSWTPCSLISVHKWCWSVMVRGWMMKIPILLHDSSMAEEEEGTGLACLQSWPVTSPTPVLWDAWRHVCRKNGTSASSLAILRLECVGRRNVTTREKILWIRFFWNVTIKRTKWTRQNIRYLETAPSVTCPQ